jgi:hypothetical protein
MALPNSFTEAPNGTPQIAYVTADQVSGQMFTSQLGASGWTPTMFTTQKPTGEPQIVTDKSGVTHLLWIASTQSQGADAAWLRYANNAGGSFQEVTVANANTNAPPQSTGYFRNAKLAVDGQGKAHLAWERTVSGTNLTQISLHYGTNAGGAFNDETVDPAYNASTTFQIVADTAGNAHVVYQVSSQSWHATRSIAGVWSKEMAPGGTLAIDPQNGLAVLGYASGSANAAALYRRQANGTWTPEVLPVQGYYGTGSLVFDAQGKPHVVEWELRKDGSGATYMRYGHRL